MSWPCEWCSRSVALVVMRSPRNSRAAAITVATGSGIGDPRAYRPEDWGRAVALASLETERIGAARTAPHRVPARPVGHRPARGKRGLGPCWHRRPVARRAEAAWATLGRRPAASLRQAVTALAIWASCRGRRLAVHPRHLGERAQRSDAAPDRRRTQLGVRPGLDALQGDRSSGGAEPPWPRGGRSRRTPATDCVILPIIKGGTVANLGDIPFQGEAITPTCDPAKLSTGRPNPANTYFNQLGCSISHGVATTPQTRDLLSCSWPASRAGCSRSRSTTSATRQVGGDAGKIDGPQNYYSAIPEGQKLTNAAVSKDGQFAMATSNKRPQTVYACLNPLGDPGDPSEADQPELLRPAGQHRAVHGGRQQQPGGRSDHRLRPGQPAVFRRAAAAHRQQLRQPARQRRVQRPPGPSASWQARRLHVTG